MSFLDKLKNKYDAKMILGSPLRVDFFNHKIQDSSEANKQAAADITKMEHRTLKELPEGKLLACYDALILVTEDSEFPIKFFCAWKHILVMKKPAIESVFIWCDEKYRSVRVDQVPIGAYCLFEYLIPKHKIVVSANEHTADGERFEKTQIKHALAKNILVYIKDEHNQFYQLDDPSTVTDAADVFWGYLPEHKQRVFVYSTENLF